MNKTMNKKNAGAYTRAMQRFEPITAVSPLESLRAKVLAEVLKRTEAERQKLPKPIPFAEWKLDEMIERIEDDTTAKVGERWMYIGNRNERTFVARRADNYAEVMAIDDWRPVRAMQINTLKAGVAYYDTNEDWLVTRISIGNGKRTKAVLYHSKRFPKGNSMGGVRIPYVRLATNIEISTMLAELSEEMLRKIAAVL